MGIVRQSALMVAAALVGCAGSAFEQGSPTGSDLAGAAGAADAGSIGTGGSSMPSGAGSSSHAGEGGGEDEGGAGGSNSSTGGSSTGGSSTGGAGGSGTGGSSMSGAGGLPSCLPGWQGSQCDTCTNSSSPVGSETCGQLLACYVAKGGTGDCDYMKPTADAVVKVAHAVLACRCP